MSGFVSYSSLIAQHSFGRGDRPIVARDTRTAQLAATKAVGLAPKSQRKEVQKAAKQLQTAAPQQQ